LGDFKLKDERRESVVSNNTHYTNSKNTFIWLLRERGKKLNHTVKRTTQFFKTKMKCCWAKCSTLEIIELFLKSIAKSKQTINICGIYNHTSIILCIRKERNCWDS
jgi:hypothetical protein